MKMYFGKFTVLSFMILLVFGCSKKDDVKPEDKDVLALEGQWKFEKLDFLDNAIVWNPDVEFNASSSFGYAPVMFTGMQGFDFLTKKVAGDLGNKFNFISEGDYNQDDTKEYWYWNYTSDKKSFEITQINPQMPPFNFAFKNISDVRMSNAGQKIVFKASLNSRKIGGGLAEMTTVPVEVTIEKGTPDADVEMFVNGQPFVMPQPLTTSEKLLNKHWKLKPGSEIYDPGLTDQDPEKEYLKVVALNLTIEDTLYYRYSFPMGIVSAKYLIQDAIDEDILKTKHGGTYGAPEQIISWKVENIDLSAKELKLKEVESGDVRTFVLTDNINTDVDKSEYTIVEN